MKKTILLLRRPMRKKHERLSQLMDEAVQRRTKFLDSISPDNKWMSMMKAATGTTELTQKLVSTMIEKVLIYEKWRCRSWFLITMMCIRKCARVFWKCKKKKEAIS